MFGMEIERDFSYLRERQPTATEDDLENFAMMVSSLMERENLSDEEARQVVYVSLYGG